MSESKTLRLHTNQEEEYPAIMRENIFVLFTTIHILQYDHSNTIITVCSDSLTVTMLGGE